MSTVDIVLCQQKNGTIDWSWFAESNQCPFRDVHPISTHPRNMIKTLNVEIYPSTLIIHKAELTFQGNLHSTTTCFVSFFEHIFCLNINLQFPPNSADHFGLHFQLRNHHSSGRFGAGQVTIASSVSQLKGYNLQPVTPKPAFLSFRASSIETSSVLPSPANFTNFSLARPTPRR